MLSIFVAFDGNAVAAYVDIILVLSGAKVVGS
jgi:hypothetical protein